MKRIHIKLIQIDNLLYKRESAKENELILLSSSCRITEKGAFSQTNVRRLLYLHYMHIIQALQRRLNIGVSS